MDTICLIMAMELLNFLNGSILVLRGWQDKLTFLFFSLMYILYLKDIACFLDSRLSLILVS